jgi:hypothetical protein
VLKARLVARLVARLGAHRRAAGLLEVTERPAGRRSGETRSGADHDCERGAPPRRFIAGADAIATAEQKVADLQAQIEAYRELSASLSFDAAEHLEEIAT